MADTKKTVLAVLGAIFLIIIILVVSAIGGMAYFVRSHMVARQTTSETASEEFARARGRFAGQPPMIELRQGAGDDDDADRFVVHRTESAPSRASLESLRVLAYDRRDHKLVHVSIPFWLLRIAPAGKTFTFPGNSNVDIGRTRLTVEDLERHGPGLILDTHDRRGSEVLVWIE